MRWPVLLIGAVLVLGVLIFAMAIGTPDSSSQIATSTATSTDYVASTTSGVEGVVSATCTPGAYDAFCRPHIRTLEAYQGISSVALFKTSESGDFRIELPPGQYELRVDTATSTHCASVGVVVTQNSFIRANISCEGALQD